jgi:hypothetical protein
MLKRLQSRAQQEELAILRDGGNVDAGDTGRDLKALLEDQVPMANTVASIQVPSFSIRKPVDELKSSAVPPAGTTPGTVKPSTAIARQPRVKGSMMDGDDNEDEDGNADVTNSAADLGDDNESHEDQPTSDIYDF